MALRDFIEKPISRYLIEIGFQPNFIADLKRGSLLIPAGLLRPEIEKALAAEQGVSLTRLEFNTDGVHLELSLARFGLRVKLHLRFEVSSSLIDGQQQIIEVKLFGGKPVGENWLGKIVAVLAGGLINRQLYAKISQIDWVSASHFDRHGGWFVLDLSSLEQLRPLKKKIPIVGLSVLDVFSVRQVEHVSGGIRLGRVSS